MKESSIDVLEFLITKMQDSEVPLSTDELTDGAPARDVQQVRCERWLHEQHTYFDPPYNECFGKYHLIQYPRTSNNVYVFLRRLERDGLCIRERNPRERWPDYPWGMFSVAVFWRWLADPEMAVDYMERLWERRNR